MPSGRKLSIRMKGEDVKLLQENLKRLGFPITDKHGFFGKSTKQAVIEFQKKHGVEMTGVVDELTANTLNSLLKEWGGLSPPTSIASPRHRGR